MSLLAQMATFVRVVEGKSLSAAARSQRMSLPAVSRQLATLEADLGASLVIRSTRRLYVTEAGRRWYEHCRRILDDVEHARADVRSSKTARGTLVVSASLTYGMQVIVPRLPELAKRHPSLVVDLRLEDQLVDLVGEGVDLAIRAGSPPPDSAAVIAHPLATMLRVLVAAPAYLRARGTPKSPRELTRHAALLQMPTTGAAVRWELRSERGRKESVTIDPSAAMRTNAPLALAELARGGMGIAYLPDWLVAADLASGALRRVLSDWTSSPLTAWALHRAELRRAPRIRAFVDMMRTP